MPKRPKEEIGLYVNGILFATVAVTATVLILKRSVLARNRDGTIDMSIVKEYVGKHRRDTKAGETFHADSQQQE